jgi:hypothetical protein
MRRKVETMTEPLQPSSHTPPEPKAVYHTPVFQYLGTVASFTRAGIPATNEIFLSLSG